MVPTKRIHFADLGGRARGNISRDTTSHRHSTWDTVCASTRDTSDRTSHKIRSRSFSRPSSRGQPHRWGFFLLRVNRHIGNDLAHFAAKRDARSSVYELRPAHAVPNSRELANTICASPIIHKDMIAYKFTIDETALRRPFRLQKKSKK